MSEQLSPWMAKLSPEARAAVRTNVAAAPALSQRQRARLRLLFQQNGGDTDAA